MTAATEAEGLVLVGLPPNLAALMDGVDLTTYPTRPWDEENAPTTICSQTDPEEWFPEKGGSVRAAKDICWGCEFRRACLADALVRNERIGMWGAASEGQRRQLRANKSIRTALARLQDTKPRTAPSGRKLHNLKAVA